jgi:endonuclease/exonuclease/phosphatase family metal-dependent hydrolase
MAAKRKQSKGSGRKNGVFFGITSRFLMSVIAALLILSYASIIINPAKIWLISLFGLFFVPLALANLILLLWAVKRRSRSALIPLLALAPGFFFIGRYVQLPSENEYVPQDPTLKIVSYNVGRFALSDKEAGIDGRGQCADSVFAFINAQDADIICLQEFYLKDLSKLKSYFNSKMKGYRAEYYMFPTRNGAFGNVTLSRIPVTGKGKVKFEESANLAIYTDHRVGDRRFRVYNCHFESYNISFTGMVRALFKADKDVFAQTGTKMKKSILRRPKQVNQVFSDIESCPVESFVCGDFNDNPMSYTYFRMTRGRKDAFVEAGDGFGATYARLWPMLRIDYVMVPHRFDALSFDTPRVKYSDHYPVITTVEL